MNQDIPTGFVKEMLDEKVDLYNRTNFIESDPISIPHNYTNQFDVEISGFFAAILAWGNRTAIIQKANRLMEMMGNEPYLFVKDSTENEIQKLNNFVYRTFNGEDLICFVHCLKRIVHIYGSIGALMAKLFQEKNDVFEMLSAFHFEFFNEKKVLHPKKHLPNPAKGSAAKRLNMYLRWMVRKDNRGVDFGLWDFIPASKLKLPLDTHSGRVARKLGLLDRKSSDRKAVDIVTARLNEFDPVDPVKYDFALFGLGIFEKF